MAIATFVHDGNAIDYTPGAAVAAGAVVVQGELIGVAKTAIAANVLGALAVSGVLGMLAMLPLQSFPMMGLVFVVAGGCFSSMPPLSLALQGLIVCPAEYPRSNSIFNVFFACGLVLGPFITGRVFAGYGGAAILFLFAALWAVFVTVSVVCRGDDPRAKRMA